MKLLFEYAEVAGSLVFARQMPHTITYSVLAGDVGALGFARQIPHTITYSILAGGVGELGFARQIPHIQ
jgi:hypothetical protein